MSNQGYYQQGPPQQYGQQAPQQANHLTSKVTNRVINKVLLQCNNKCNTLLNNSQSRRGVPVVVDVSVLVSPHCAVAASAKRDARPVPIALSVVKDVAK
ncbi:hypothetical protein B2J93_8597 [Marssonina coronariae]|uniref:Uncharacterized protein n=1 Tax=Diplocarpon coronariae TaxID=2795749 RepID=A0A218YSV4_9HELO|nr:hypothetical protein B2J93_8597 [Marssonina coronariae]